jgi:prolyl-tRNA editing enzyme YbaK/EbsC (Cys-tRNA(Pro) deacylase)
MVRMPLHPNVQAVQDALDAAGVTDSSGQPCQAVILPDAVHTAAAAAAALGVEVGQIANSLIFDAAGEPLLVLTSGAHRVDTAKVATLLGIEKINRASADFVRQHTGQPIGGVAPIHPNASGKQMRTLIDVDLYQYQEIWAAAGVPQSVFPITPPELRRLTDGTDAEVA